MDIASKSVLANHAIGLLQFSKGAMYLKEMITFLNERRKKINIKSKEYSQVNSLLIHSKVLYIYCLLKDNENELYLFSEVMDTIELMDGVRPDVKPFKNKKELLNFCLNEYNRMNAVLGVGGY